MAWLAWHSAYLPRTEKPVDIESLTKGGSDRHEDESFLALRLSNASKSIETININDHLRSV